MKITTTKKSDLSKGSELRRARRFKIMDGSSENSQRRQQHNKEKYPSPYARVRTRTRARTQGHMHVHMYPKAWRMGEVDPKSSKVLVKWVPARDPLHKHRAVLSRLGMRG